MTSHPQRHSFQVTGDGHQGISLSGVGRSAFSRRKPGVSSRWPNGRRLSSRCPCPSPVTESFCLCFAACQRASMSPRERLRPRPLLHRSSAPICTFALPLLPSCPQVLRPSCPLTRLACQRVNLPACPLAQARVPMSPRERLRPRAISFPSSLLATETSPPSAILPSYTLRPKPRRSADTAPGAP